MRSVSEPAALLPPGWLPCRKLEGAPTAECVLGPETRRLGGQWLGAALAGLDDLAAVVFGATEGLVPVTHQPYASSPCLQPGGRRVSLSSGWSGSFQLVAEGCWHPGRGGFPHMNPQVVLLGRVRAAVRTSQHDPQRPWPHPG